MPTSRRFLPAIVLIAATALAYGPVLRSGFIWDDDSHITENLTLRSASGLHDIWLQPGATMQHYPLTFSVWWAGYHLWGLNPFGYHLVTLLMHIAVSLMLWRVLRRLEVPGAWLGGMIFALHPVNVMSVAWATELKNTLSGVLALGSCWAYLRFMGSATRKWRFYALSLVLFLLAILAKTAVGFLPATLLLIVWWKNDRVRARDVLSVAPMAALALSTAFVTVYVEHHSGGAIGPQFAIPFVDRILISGRSFWFYLGKLVVPYPLIFIYDRWTIDPRHVTQWLYPAATAALLAVLFALRGRIGKGPFVAAFHFYLGTSALIFVVVTYMTRFSFVSDHWQYFGAMSAAALAGAWAFRLVSRATGARRVAVVAVVALWVTGLGAATRHQTAIYRTRDTLYRATLARNPRCWMACDNLALSLILSGRNDEAMDLLNEALRLKPDYAEAHLNLGNLLAASGRPEAAIEHLNEAKRLVPEYSAKVEFNIADLMRKRGDIGGAIEHYREALRFDPKFADAHNNLGYALTLRGQYAEAIEQFEQALSIKPDAPEARRNLEDARAAMAGGSTATNAAAILASCVALTKAGRSDEAIACFGRALARDPGSAEAHNDLGVVLAGAGRIDEALVHFREAVRLAPDSEAARDNLRRAEESSGRPR